MDDSFLAFGATAAILGFVLGLLWGAAIAFLVVAALL